MIQIATERLLLRVLGKSAAPSVLAYLERNRTFFEPWVPRYPEHFFEQENVEKTLEREWFAIASGQLLRLYIFHQTDDNQSYILGDITYSQIQRGSTQSCFVGYKIDERANGKGIATEALRAGNDYMLHKVHLHRLEADIMPRNKASIAVAEKLGFSCEGLARKLLKINGKWEDHLRYVLLNEENEDEIGF